MASAHWRSTVYLIWLYIGNKDILGYFSAYFSKLSLIYFEKLKLIPPVIIFTFAWNQLPRSTEIHKTSQTLSAD